MRINLFMTIFANKGFSIAKTGILIATKIISNSNPYGIIAINIIIEGYCKSGLTLTK